MTGSFGERLRKMRTFRGLNQTGLAELVGVSGSSISLLESGRRLPGYRMLLRLSQALGVTVGFLCGDEAAPMPEPFNSMLHGLSPGDLHQVLYYASFLSRQSRNVSDTLRKEQNT